MRREFCLLAAIAAAAGAATALLGGSVHEAVTYGLALMTGGLFGLGLARRPRCRAQDISPEPDPPMDDLPAAESFGDHVLAGGNPADYPRRVRGPGVARGAEAPNYPPL